MEFRVSVFFTIGSVIFSVLSVLADNVFNTTDSLSWSDRNNVTVKCGKPPEHDSTDIREVLGKWKAVELYNHKTNEGITRYQTCPHVIIWETADFPETTFGPTPDGQHFVAHHVEALNSVFRQNNRHLRMLWDENGNTVEYPLYFRNDTAGYWHVDAQNGTLTQRPNFQQFSGTIQVLTATHDHLVLHFCQEAVGARPAQLYSVLFSRNPGDLSAWELDSVHSMLQNKQLSVTSRRLVCGNSGAGKALQSIILTGVMCLMAFIIKA